MHMGMYLGFFLLDEHDFTSCLLDLLHVTGQKLLLFSIYEMI